MRNKLRTVRPELNITSMLDVVFNLIFFFVLITNFSAAERAAIVVPKPDNSIALEPHEPNTVVVSVLPDKTAKQIADAEARGERLEVRVKTVKFGVNDEFPLGEQVEKKDDQGKIVKMDRLTWLLKGEVKGDKEVLVCLRADKSICYRDMPQIMKAIADAGVGRISIVCLAKE